jgi:iron complex transport system substrate-binding protein
MRVVSLTCSNTEIVCALGAAETLVGIDDHSDFPVEVCARLPRVGPDLSIDVEAVRRLEPDLVLASLTVPGHERVVEAVDRAGLRWIAPAPERFADVLADVRQIGGLLGRAEAAERAAAELEAGAPAVPEPERRPSILVEWWPKPVIAPGRRSWVTDLLERAGARNPLAERDCLSTPLTDDEVRALAPDVVVISWCGVPTHRYRRDVVLRRPAWRDVPAVAASRVVPVSEAFLGRPGPRLVEGYRAFREIVASLG